MKLRKLPFGVSLCFPAILFDAVPVLRAADNVEPGVVKAIPVDAHWQLFLDDYIIARSTGLTRKLQQPQPRGLVIPAQALGNGGC